MKTHFKRTLISTAVLATTAFSSQAFAMASQCEGVEEWQADKVYTGGQQAVELNKLYEANWWTRGNKPSAHSGNWQEWDYIVDCDPQDITYYVPQYQLMLTPASAEEGTEVAISVLDMIDPAPGSRPYEVASYEVKVDGVTVRQAATAEVVNVVATGIGQHTVEVMVTFDGTTETQNVTGQFTVTQAQENIPPTVTLTSPNRGEEIQEGFLTFLEADASDADGTVEKVDFYVDDALIETDFDAPYSVTWSAVLGDHAIQARATDDKGAVTLSTEITVSVINGTGGGSGCADVPVYEVGGNYNIGDQVSNGNEKFECKIGGWCSSNAAWAYEPGVGAHWTDAWEGLGVCTIEPEVSITSPSDNAVLLAGTEVAFTANASDADGMVTEVEFFADNVSLGVDTTAPYATTWTPVAKGNVQLKAVAQDDEKNKVESTVSVTVSDEPVVATLTAPVSGSKVGLGNSVTFAADASSVAGAVTKVEFLVNGQVVGSDMSEPYSLQWTPSAVGSYTVTAKVTDDMGNMSTSAGSTISVSEVVLSEHKLVGYWHNFENGAGCPIDLGDISPDWDVIDIAFADNDRNSNGTVHFNLYAGGQFTSCKAIDPAKFKQDVKDLQAQGKKIVLSLGGAEGTITLNTDSDEVNFVNSLTDIIAEWGFDGLDVDLESGSNLLHGTQIQARLGRALMQIEQNMGGDMYLTMAPEHPYVQGGHIAYSGIWGAYVPVIDATRDTLDLLHVQLYNNGGLPHPYNGGQIAQIGSTDMMVASAKMLIEGFELADGSMFAPLRPDQVSLGLPSGPKAAGSGQATNQAIFDALDCLTTKTKCGEIVPNEAYPTFSGVMTWSINWDIYDGFIFSKPIKEKLNTLPKK
ncbi:chitinase [Catenovulum sp. SM1970]|uniref:Ig-like domain-containing protein n=1 Tax=Marinifaba aquimaris TaxID=2741323 RepID=UPI00157314CA|nr:Ig-like domain-containing protein [Marinifaba aquimaris]NTS77825.1 chitinase [Marinifaba aquimaris]